MPTAVLILLIVVATIIGDYFIKVSSQRDQGLITAHFLWGAVLYALPAIGWFFLMRTHSLAEASVMYSAATLFGMALLGVLVFNETISLRQVAGLIFAAIAVWLMKP